MTEFDYIALACIAYGALLLIIGTVYTIVTAIT